MLDQMIAVLAVAGLAPLALAAPAAAAPGNGAVQYGFDPVCISEPPFEFCIGQRGVFNVTETPSGDFHLIDNGVQTFTSAEGNFTDNSRSRYRLVVLLKDGQEQVVHVGSQFTSKASNGFSCRISVRFMVVKGEVKREIEVVACDPVPEP